MYDIAIIGCGVIGAATAYALSRREGSVVVPSMHPVNTENRKEDEGKNDRAERLETAACEAHGNRMTDKPKNNTARNAALAAAGAIGSAAIAAALLYAGKRKKKPNEPTQPGPIPSGEPPETD